MLPRSDLSSSCALLQESTSSKCVALYALLIASLTNFKLIYCLISFLTSLCLTSHIKCKSFGMRRILQAIGADNVYRNEDEWSFEYDSFGMPVRAYHLTLGKWADIMVVAPITCNSMAKAVAGIRDNLLSSVFVA